jgi:hypothetical protein
MKPDHAVTAFSDNSRKRDTNAPSSAGELTAVWVPDQAHEAIRDLVRARQAAVRTLRHRCHYHRPAWTQLHRRWLASLKFDQAVHHIVLEDCIAAVEAAMARRDRLETHIAVSSSRHRNSLLVLQAVQHGRHWAKQEARS